MWKSFPRMPFVWSLFLSEVHGAVEHDGLKNDEVMALQTFDISHVNNLEMHFRWDFKDFVLQPGVMVFREKQTSISLSILAFQYNVWETA